MCIRDRFGSWLLDIALRQLSLSSISKDSEAAFHAAHAGIECARLRDTASGITPYAIPYQSLSDPYSIVPCMGAKMSSEVRDIDSKSGGFNNNQKALYQYEYDWAGLCSSISVYKYYKADDGDSNTVGPDRSEEVTDLKTPCPENSTCTIIKSRGYSDECDNIGLPGTIEREVVSIY